MITLHRALLASAALTVGLVLAVTTISSPAQPQEANALAELPTSAAEQVRAQRVVLAGTPRPLPDLAPPTTTGNTINATRRVATPVVSTAIAVLGRPRHAPDHPAVAMLEVAFAQAAAALALPPTAPLAQAVAPPPVLAPRTIAATNSRSSTVRVATPPSVTARNAVVLDEQSLAVLYDKGANERRAPASLTKIVTAALAVQHGNLDDLVLNTVDAYDMPGSSLMLIRPGDAFTLRDLLYGMMLRSGNDAAIAIGRHLAVNDATFVDHMNELVDRLGLQDTHFIDPHGLGGRGHYSSAYDLAILARYGMQFPDFATVAGARTWKAQGSRTIDMSNLNPFMKLYPGADGLKTGFTYAAGPTFIGSAVRNGKRLYVVLLNSSDRWGDAVALLDWAFANHTWPAPNVAASTAGEAITGTASAAAVNVPVDPAADLEIEGITFATGLPRDVEADPAQQRKP